MSHTCPGVFRIGHPAWRDALWHVIHVGEWVNINMTRVICLVAGNVLGGEVNTSKFSDRLEREKLTRTSGQSILLLLLAGSVHTSFGIQGKIGGLIVNCNQRV